MKHEYLVLDCIRNLKTLINEYVIHQHKNSMTERSRKARRVISNFTLPQPKEEGEKEHKDFLCDYLYHKKNEPKQKESKNLLQQRNRNKPTRNSYSLPLMLVS